MAPTKTIPCRFFARGSCRNGDRCNLIHGKQISTQNEFEPVTSATTAVKNMYIHPLPTALDPSLGQGRDISRPASSDTRGRVLCKFSSLLGGCQDSSCSYLHARDSEEMANTDQEQVDDDDFSRVILGASVSFNESGHVDKLSLPTDYSLACITGLPPGVTPEALVSMLGDLGFNLTVDSVRIIRQIALTETKATVKLEYPLTIQYLSTKLKRLGSPFAVTPVASDVNQANCRKVHISWHKASRTVWLNFGSDEIAGRVGQNFNEGKYKCLGYHLQSSPARESKIQGRSASYNPLGWSITLTGVPSKATSADIRNAIKFPRDQPRRIHLGPGNYQASDTEVMGHVRSRLEEHGPIESFYFPPATKGKRAKATALFRDEADAKSACSLNDMQLDILGKGKLTVTLVHSAKFKVIQKVYRATKSKIDNETKIWKEQYIAIHIYDDASQRFTSLKVEGDNANDVAKARKALGQILEGDVLKDGNTAIWSPAFNINGETYEKLRLVEKKLDVVITRDRSNRQIRFYGPPEKYQQAAHQVTNIVKNDLTKNYEIHLDPSQISWVMHGGFRSIQQELGKNVAVFNVVSKKITINGTLEEHETALAIMDAKHTSSSSVPKEDSKLAQDCPICFCEADNPIQLSCKHVYCLECFEDYCKSAASTSKENFQVNCQGDEGSCSATFPLHELKSHLPSSVFEAVLQSSLEEYIQRRPNEFGYCPTPGCSYIYRCTAASTKPPSYTCPKCFEPLCTSCHEPHVNYNCPEHKDRTCGNDEKLKQLKMALNIKDCPKCRAPMEKTDGCNHMTCGVCKAHICWFCMAFFETSRPCYVHMNQEHGGIYEDAIYRTG